MSSPLRFQPPQATAEAPSGSDAGAGSIRLKARDLMPLSARSDAPAAWRAAGHFTGSNAIVRFFAWNMPFHAEHHAYPAVPFHALPRLNRLLAGHIVHTESGYCAATATVVRHLLAPPASVCATTWTPAPATASTTTPTSR